MLRSQEMTACHDLRCDVIARVGAGLAATLYFAGDPEMNRMLIMAAVFGEAVATAQSARANLVERFYGQGRLRTDCGHR